MKAELASASGTVIPVKCDLRKESDVTSMFEVIEECGGADVCVNSAGLNYFNTLLNSTNDQLREILEVNNNILSHTLCCGFHYGAQCMVVLTLKALNCL